MLSRHLYLAARHYPLTPVVDWLPAIPFPFDHILLWALVATLATTMFLRRRAIVLAALAVVAILALGDQSRWQPWFYQYAIMLAVLAICFHRPADMTDLWRLIIAMTYGWSGVQKLNVTFMASLFPWLLEPFVGSLPEPARRLMNASGAVVPVVEVAIGVALLSRRYRRAAVILAVAMHAFILAAVGPLGHHTNTVIWPWNVAMALFVVLLFWNPHAPSSIDLLAPRRLGAHAIVLALVGVLPALSFAGGWDAYLSGTLYSGNIKAALAVVSGPVKARLPLEVQRLVRENNVRANVLDIWEWSLSELNAPSYPEDRVYRSVGRYLCRFADAPSDVLIVVFEKPDLLTGHRARTFYDCAALLGPDRTR